MQFQKILFLLVFLGFGLFVKAQVKPTIKEFAIVDEDTIILSKVPEVEILAFKDYDEKTPNSFGILSMKERAYSLGGELSIISKLNKMFSIT